MPERIGPFFGEYRGTWGLMPPFEKPPNNEWEYADGQNATAALEGRKICMESDEREALKDKLSRKTL